MKIFVLYYFKICKEIMTQFFDIILTCNENWVFFKMTKKLINAAEFDPMWQCLYMNQYIYSFWVKN